MQPDFSTRSVERRFIREVLRRSTDGPDDPSPERPPRPEESGASRLSESARIVGCLAMPWDLLARRRDPSGHSAPASPAHALARPPYPIEQKRLGGSAATRSRARGQLRRHRRPIGALARRTARAADPARRPGMVRQEAVTNRPDVGTTAPSQIGRSPSVFTATAPTIRCSPLRDGLADDHGSAEDVLDPRRNPSADVNTTADPLSQLQRTGSRRQSGMPPVRRPTDHLPASVPGGWCGATDRTGACCAACRASSSPDRAGAARREEGPGERSRLTRGRPPEGSARRAT